MRIKIRYHKVRPSETEPLSSMHGWTRWVFFALIGSFFGRSFFYIGIPPAKIFIGEVGLVLFVLLRPRELFDRWIRGLTRGGDFGPFAWLLLMLVLYGGFEVLYGIHSGYPVLPALEELVFNIYPVYFFLGLWIGTSHPTLLQKLIRTWAWMLTIYGPLYLLVLGNITLTMPGTDNARIFSQAGGGGGLILSLLALERKPLRFWLPMLCGAILMLVIQVRAEWLGMVVGFLIWGMLERKMSKVLSVFALLVALLLAGFIADVDLPGPAGRGGRISSSEIAARGLSAISPQLAEEYTSSKNIGMYAGTVSWRTRWWTAIWSSVHDESLTKTLIGNGYGYPLADLVPYLRNVELRTPHNVFFFALGYSGWIGVLLFFSVQFAIFKMLWRVYKLTGQAYGLAIWAFTLTTAFFGDAFESPTVIPSYICIGLFIGPVLCGKLAVLVPNSPYRSAPDMSVTTQTAYSRFLPSNSP
jgi:hypothetical protein